MGENDFFLSQRKFEAMSDCDLVCEMDTRYC